MPGKIYIYGKHALEEALAHAPHAVGRVYLEGRGDTALRKALELKSIPILPLSEGLPKADVRSGASHQGVVAQILLSRLLVPYRDYREHTPAGAVLFLDSIQDPHNVGALIRSAAAFGAAAVFLPERKQSPITPAVIKASSGGAFQIPLVSVPHTGEALKDLKEKGFAIYGLAGKGGTSVAEESFGEKAVFVLGNESTGLSADAKAHCTEVLSIPMDARAESLNVAAAGAVALYAWHVRPRK